MGELKNKCLQLTIQKDELVVKRFWGLKTDVYKASQLGGWKLSHQNYNHKHCEFIFLYVKIKKLQPLPKYIIKIITR